MLEKLEEDLLRQEDRRRQKDEQEQEDQLRTRRLPPSQQVSSLEVDPTSEVHLQHLSSAASDLPLPLPPPLQPPTPQDPSRPRESTHPRPSPSKPDATLPSPQPPSTDPSLTPSFTSNHQPTQQTTTTRTSTSTFLSPLELPNPHSVPQELFLRPLPFRS